MSSPTSRKKKEIFTRIDYELYEKIKEKGYKISELIELGFKYKEKDAITEEKLCKFLSELNNAINEIKTISKPVKLVVDYLNELEEFISVSKSRISSKIFPSKYDAINTLSEIEKRIKELKSKIS